MISFDDLRNAPPRKPSAKRAQQDREIFRSARRLHHKRMADRAAETTEDRELRDSIDWGIEFEDNG